MKKLLVLMAIAIIMATGVFAATSVDGDGTDPSSEDAKINVTLGLAGGEGSRIYETGFTSSAVNPGSPNAVALENEDFALTINTTDWTAANAANSLYAYWVILSNETVDVSLSIPADGLSSTTLDEPKNIEWASVKLTPDSSADSVNTTTFPGNEAITIESGFGTALANDIVIASHDGTSGAVKSVGSVGLEFKVAGLDKAEADTYEAAITLKVETVN